MRGVANNKSLSNKDLKYNQEKIKNFSKSKYSMNKSSIRIKKEDLREKVRKHGIKAAITAVIDMSGSMIADEKLKGIKAILQKIITNVQLNKDKLAIVGFRVKDSEIIIPSTKRPNSFLNNLQNISIGGTTPMAAGLKKALEILKKEAKNEEYIPIMLILSDGVTNVGLDKESEGNYNKNIRKKIEKNQNYMEKNSKRLISNPVADVLAIGEEIAKNKIHTIIVNIEKEKNKGISVNKELAFITNGRFYDLGRISESLEGEEDIDNSSNSLVFGSAKSDLLDLAIDGILDYERSKF
ncbi:MAG: VWA domain-containing protein [Methanobrevibacter sp.]|nr:VWA domain-containing protein [Methanobrevibacter sp.]